ncbi:hypothetical protein CU633_02365 [Bacillus sp. V3-13]|uniref:DUF5344 family protein n=1 Tax=Bacillus sp. V3-13 TaxID=2053728 RepID=UPI000C7894C7|nr:DUF5344 family protein [Bacillus sp. V3-13]PLR79049.1 hypothetical protein CU633_02365 [Bacillus sp. V3-13]
MSKEIRIEYSEVTGAISQTTSAIQLVKTDLPNVDEGRNQLTSLSELKSLMQELTKAMISYQNILTDNLDKTTSLIESVRETDQQAASGIRKGESK